MCVCMYACSTEGVCVCVCLATRAAATVVPGTDRERKVPQYLNIYSFMCVHILLLRLLHGPGNMYDTSSVNPKRRCTCSIIAFCRCGSVMPSHTSALSVHSCP